jgi:class 3 adenylate cyclase
MHLLLPDQIEAHTNPESRLACVICANKPIDQTSPISGPRIGATRVTASALSTPARPGELAVASVTTRCTSKGTLDATVIAAETTHAAVLFVDMRGFTGLAERLKPARVVCLLNEFFTVEVEGVAGFRGIVKQ